MRDSSNNSYERHFFLEKNAKRIYCSEYSAQNAMGKSHGVILCAPIWGERMRTRRIFTNLARRLAKVGYSVIRCDYYGDGNSGGETAELTYEGMKDDIRNLYGCLVSKSDIDRVTLVGLRIGANCAASLLEELDCAIGAILVEPIVNLADFFRDALRANLSSQMTMHKKILKNREQLIDEIRNGILVDIDGFLVGKEFWESFEQAGPLSVACPANKTVTIISMFSRGKRVNDYSRCVVRPEVVKFETIDQEFIWTDWKYYNPCPTSFFDRILGELRAHDTA